MITETQNSKAELAKRVASHKEKLFDRYMAGELTDTEYCNMLETWKRFEKNYVS